VDQPGKDSYRHRHAGASEVMVVSDRRWVIMHELRDESEPTLEEQIEKVSPCDLLLVEGHKHHPPAQARVWRKENGKPLLASERHPISSGIACDSRSKPDLPRFDLNDHKSIEEFIVSYKRAAMKQGPALRRRGAGALARRARIPVAETEQVATLSAAGRVLRAAQRST